MEDFTHCGNALFLFLHRKVAQGWKKDEIAGLTQQLRKVKDDKGYKSVKAPAVAAEVVVKQWLLRHASERRSRKSRENLTSKSN